MKIIYRVIELNQKDWLKPYIDMNTELRQKAKNNFEKDFLNLMNNAVFGKTRDVKLVTTERRRNYLVSEPNYFNHKIFHRKFISIRNEKNANNNE